MAAAKPDLAPRDFVLPLDVDVAEVRKAIEAKLGGGSGNTINAEPVIERRAGGRVAIPARHLLRLGDGRFDLGRQFMQGLIRQIRARRMRRNATAGRGRAETAATHVCQSGQKR